MPLAFLPTDGVALSHPKPTYGVVLSQWFEMMDMRVGSLGEREKKMGDGKGNTTVEGLTRKLFDAAAKAASATVWICAQGGADIDARDADRMTPTMRAAQAGCLDSVLALAWAGADLRAVDDLGFSAADHAFAEGARSVVETLTELGAGLAYFGQAGGTFTATYESVGTV